MKLVYFFWVGLVQSLAQQISKKVMIAIPTPFIIQWDNEKIAAFKGFERILSRERDI
jgi:hypothetical protein